MTMSFNPPSVLYFYGLSGAGKNYVGDILGRLTGWPVYHADVDLTQEMLLAIAKKSSFGQEMRDRYYAIVADRILDLQEKHGHLVVSQATYKRRHRDYLLSRVPNMEMICVTASDAAIVKRLQRRSDSITPDYAARMKFDFEPPAKGARVIENNAGPTEVITQILEMYPGLQALHQVGAAAAITGRSTGFRASRKLAK